MKKYFILATAIITTIGLGLYFKESIAKSSQLQQEEQAPQIEYTRTIQEYNESGYSVNLTIVKGDITGTAKIQETIPDGFAVEFNETSTALTTVNGNTVKFLWENLPNDNIIQLAYTCYKSGKFSKELTIGGYFLYLDNDIANKKISEPTSFTFKDGKITLIELDEKKKEKYLNKQQEGIDPSDITPKEEKKEVLSVRDFSEPKTTTPTEASDDLATNSGNSTANETETSQDTNSSTSANNESTGSEELSSNEIDIVNNSDIDLNTDENTEDFNLSNSESNINSNSELTNANDINYTESNGSDSSSDSNFDTNSEVENVDNLSELSTNNNSSNAPSEATLAGNNNTNNPTGGTEGLIYKVQVCALEGTPVSPGYFNEKHSISDEITQESHEGWTKYTTGMFSVYKQSRDHRENLRDNHEVIGPFVTAYNNGERITVQEALMLSKQKWYK